MTFVIDGHQVRRSVIRPLSSASRRNDALWSTGTALEAADALPPRRPLPYKAECARESRRGDCSLDTLSDQGTDPYCGALDNA